jgi:anaphase-promoting complex subunit 6
MSDVETTRKTIRQTVQDLMAKHDYRGAIFMSSKLSLMSNFAPKDVFLLANSFYLDQQYARCFDLLDARGLADVDVRFRLLAARCLMAQKLYDETVALLDDAGATSVDDLGYETGGVKMASAICAVLAKAYEMLENFDRSTQWYRDAVMLDPGNCEAFVSLMQAGRLSEAEEIVFVDEVVSRLPDSLRWLKSLYTSMLSGRSTESIGRIKSALEDISGNGGNSDAANNGKMETRSSRRRQQLILAPTPPSTLALSQDSDVVRSRAMLLTREGRHHEAYALVKSVLDRDHFNPTLLPVYLSIAVKLGKKNDVFILGHKLMEKRPGDAESWYTAGCYYYITEQYASARSFFGKATSLNKMFAPAWIGFAHAFAMQSETDQAMAAYRTAARLFPGLPQPVLGMALEYARMNNLGLAQKLCSIAYRKNPHDPVLLLESGVIAYRNAKYDESLSLLKKAVDAFDEADDGREIALVNLGHCYRKLGMYGESIEALTRALALDAFQPGTYSALAYAHHLAGDPLHAVDAYHKALSLHPEDPFATSMLEIALKESEPLTLERLIVAGDSSTTSLMDADYA